MKNNRHRRILSELKSDVAQSVSDLASLCGVSDMTLRRDLHELERSGRIRRVWGGAVLVDQDDPGYLQRATENINAKRRLADHVAGMLSPHQSLFVDAGSTAAEIAKAIARRAKRESFSVRITTCSIPVASHLVSVPGVSLYQLGGEVDDVTQSVFGAAAMAQVAQLHFDTFVFSGSGIDPINGVTNASSSAVDLKRAAMAKAKETWCVADGSKWGKTGFFRVCAFDEVTHLVTDVWPPDLLQSALPARKLIICD